MPPDTSEPRAREPAVPAHEMPPQLPARPSHEPSTTQRPPDHAERLLELAGAYVKGVLADVEVIVEGAAARAREIPDQPEFARDLDAAWTVIGELLIRVAALEKDLEERDTERRRRRKR